MTAGTDLRPSLTILDVGHGNCAVLTDTRGIVVIDTGLGNSLLEHLHQAHISQVDTVLLSHADHDHIDGLSALLASGQFGVRQVLVNSDAKKRSASWDNLTHELSLRHDRGELRFHPAIVPDFSGTLNVGEVGIEVLAPSGYLAARGPGSSDKEGRTLTSNSNSAVVRLVHQGLGAVLLPGDLDVIGLDGLLHRLTPERVRSRILVFPHHGGRSGDYPTRMFVRRLIESVRPEIVVFSIGRGRYGNPQPEVVDEIRRVAPSIWITCTQLSKHCAQDTPPETPSHLAPQFAAGRVNRTCCAGSIIVRFGSQMQVEPQQAAHLEFIRQAAASALCRRVLASD